MNNKMYAHPLLPATSILKVTFLLGPADLCSDCKVVQVLVCIFTNLRLTNITHTYLCYYLLIPNIVSRLALICGFVECKVEWIPKWYYLSPFIFQVMELLRNETFWSILAFCG